MLSYWRKVSKEETSFRKPPILWGRVVIRVYSLFAGLGLNVDSGLQLSPPSLIRGSKYIRIGKNFIAGSRLRLEAISQVGDQIFTPSIDIGDCVQLNDDVHIGAIGRLKIGNNVLMASKIFISDHLHGGYSQYNSSPPEIQPSLRLLSHKDVTIEDNVWIGEMVSILPGVTIGKGSIIGANSVVTKNIPPNSIAVGVPAQVIKRFDFKRKIWIKV